MKDNNGCRSCSAGRYLLILLTVIVGIAFMPLQGIAEANAADSGRTIAQPAVKYSVCKGGWSAWKKDGQKAGAASRGAAKCLKIKLSSTACGQVKYGVYAKKKWSKWKYSGRKAGQKKKSCSIRAIRIELTGDLAKCYDVRYRVHKKSGGWTGWKQNGAAAGSRKTAVTAVQIKLVKYKDAYGFYRWIINKYANDPACSWKAADAENALSILKNSSWRKYTHRKRPGDATADKNIRATMPLLNVLNKVRKNDDNFDLDDAYVTCELMARAQVNGNASAVTNEHMVNDSGSSLGHACECLDWGYKIEDNGPFDDWYYGEKKAYEKKRAYVLKTYKIDINDYSQQSKYLNIEGVSEIEARYATGHYEITCHDGYDCYDFTGPEDTVTFVRYKRIICGLSYGYGCSCLEMDGLEDNADQCYSVEEFKAMYDQYRSEVPAI